MTQEVVAAENSRAAIRIHEFRLSFIMAETNVPLLGADAILATQEKYLGVFNALPQETIRLPWNTKSGDSFWGPYVHQPSLAIDGWSAWKNLVPLRSILTLKATPTHPAWKAGFAGYLYPFGQTAVVTVNVDLCKDGIPLEEMAEMAVDLRGRKFQIDGSEELISVKGLAEKALDLLRRSASAATPLNPGDFGDIFTVATVLRGTGVTFPKPVPNPPVDVAILPKLWALASGVDTYDEGPPAEFHSILPLKKSASKYHVLYGWKHGRTVWFPSKFRTEESLHSSGVYHRNLTACSAQVESLCGFISLAGRLEMDKKLPYTAHTVLRYAIDALTRLYSGSKTTYKTRSVVNQIAERDKDFLKEMDAVRHALGLPDFDINDKPKP